jgi:integrase/recombinase XerD
MDDRPALRLVPDTPIPGVVNRDAELPVDPLRFQARCLGGFSTSQLARGFSPRTIASDSDLLERFLTLAGKPAWELTADDLDRVVQLLVERGVGAVTRRDYVGTFRQFFAYLQARHAAEIQRHFGIRLADPVDRFHAGRHVADGAPATRTPPSPQRMEAFFGFMRQRMDTARKWTPLARDYALFRTLYHAGLRAGEAAALELRDLHFDRGPFGKLHVRLGKAAKGSGPRPRWVPMLDDLGLLLRWYVDQVRPRFRIAGPVAFCDEAGGPLAPGTIRNRLHYLLELEGRPPEERFSPHDLRHACATRNYERGVDLVAIQQLLGHWHIGTTMKYVSPSATFIEDAYRRALSDTLAVLHKEE